MAFINGATSPEAIIKALQMSFWPVMRVRQPSVYILSLALLLVRSVTGRAPIQSLVQETNDDSY